MFLHNEVSTLVVSEDHFPASLYTLAFFGDVCELTECSHMRRLRSVLQNQTIHVTL